MTGGRELLFEFLTWFSLFRLDPYSQGYIAYGVGNWDGQVLADCGRLWSLGYAWFGALGSTRSGTPVDFTKSSLGFRVCKACYLVSYEALSTMR